MNEGTSQSKAGFARAEALSPTERKEIASKAGKARWKKEESFPQLPQATHDGDLEISGRIIKAAVLPNGLRLITQGTFLQALGRSRTPKAGTGGLATVDDLPFFLQAEQLKPFISDDLRLSTTPIFFRLKSGQRAVGYDARLLNQVCEVYLKFRDSCMESGKVVPRNYQHIVKACDLLMRGFAGVGIIALVDEATGYQYDRARDALARILEEFIAKELQPWTKTFPMEFYRNIFRLRGWPFNPNNVKRPQIIAYYTTDFVYKRLAPGVYEELMAKNPVIDGRRKHKLFQWLTGEIGHPKLRSHLDGLLALMRVSDSWGQFKQFLNKAYPKYERTELGFTLELRDKK